MMRGSVLRGITRAVAAADLLDPVRAAVSDEVRALIDDPPLSVRWISHGAMEEIAVAATSLVGLRQWGEIAYVAARDGILPILRGPCESFLRLFGATPITLLSRLDTITALSVRGLRFHFAASSERDGDLTITFDGCKGVPAPLFHGTAQSVRLIFDLTGYPGVVHTIDVAEDGARNSGTCQVRW
jgi:hypothetical protein